MQARRVPQFSTPSSDIRSVFQRAEEAHAALEKLEDAILSAEAKRRISAAESGKAEGKKEDTAKKAEEEKKSEEQAAAGLGALFG